MDCPTEEGLIRSKLGSMAGVMDLQFNLVQRKLTVRHSPEILPKVCAALASLGLDAEVERAESTAAHEAPLARPTNWWIVAASGSAAALAELEVARSCL